MGGEQNKNKSKVKVFKSRQKKTKSETEEIEKLRERYDSINTDEIKSFKDFPLSNKTLHGLRESGYTIPTKIQLESIALSLKGLDILGAAKTGSGKTLAFLIPILENLYCQQWTNLDGLGALIITPTRELAYQIFETLRSVGSRHDFSAGLIIGGKDLHFETKRMDRCNIIICTPGRLLHHMDKNPIFDPVNLKILVLDEADRCLDMGFENAMNAIIKNLPPVRQTLLFSATQTKSVKALARLSLKNPMYVSVHEHAKHSTPETLKESYIVCELKDKMSVLWSFVKNHLKYKSLIFFSSCKQVKYAYEIFCKLRPGVSLLALYGTLHQQRRMQIYESFKRKSHAVLFATDIASRGLDFPSVNWVVQVDCPEDVNTYIHRVGRTARYEKDGESLLILLPNEEKAIIPKIKERKIPIEKIRISSERLLNPQPKMEAFLAHSPALKESAQRAFIAYIKSVFLMKDKEIFDVNALDTDAFCRSLGLAIPPRIRFLQRYNKKLLETQSNKKPTLENAQSIDTDDDDDNEVDQSSIDRPQNNKHVFESLEDSESDDDMLKIKRKDHDIDFEDLPAEDSIENQIELSKKKKVLTKAAIAKKVLKKNIVPNTKTVFTEEGDAVIVATKEKQSEVAKNYENENEGGINIEKAKLILKEEDKFDKQRFREKIKAKHKAEKLKLKQMKEKEKINDDFEDEESDEGPDLSWVPDPDKIYGKKNSEDNTNSEDSNREEADINSDSENSHDNTGSESEESEMSSESNHRSKKRKLKDSKKSVKKLKTDIKAVTDNLSDAEELALQLLRNIH